MKKFSFIFICFTTVYFSCTEKKQGAIEAKPVKKAVGRLVTDSVAPPIVTPIGPANPLPVTVTTKPYSLDPSMGKEAISSITPADGLPAARFYFNVVQDKAGNFWFTSSTKIIKYDGHNFTSYPLVAGDNVRCYSIAMASNNELWAVMSQPDSTGLGPVGSLYIFNGLSYELLPVIRPEYKYKKNYYGIQLYPQPDGSLWAATGEQKELLKFEGRQLKKRITPRDFPFTWITDITTDPKGNIWFTDRRDSILTRYDGRTYKKFTYADGLPRSDLWNTLPFSADSIYIATTNGTFFYDGHRSVKVNGNFASSLLLDKQGTLWMENRNGNGVVDKISSSGITPIGREDGLVVSDARSFVTDRDDNVWVAAQNCLNLLYKPVVTYGNIFPASGNQQGVRSFLNDRDGRNWFGSWTQGISCYSAGKLAHYSFPANDTMFLYATDNNIGGLTQDKAGNIWISTARGSLIKFDGRSFFINNRSNGFIEGFSFAGVMADSKGNIWFSTGGTRARAGVACFNGRQKISYSTAQGLCNNTVNCIFEDGKGAMWFGTPDGLSCLQNGRFTTFSEQDGLASNGINSINGDEYGNLWLGTQAGLSRFDGERFINYSADDGLGSGAITSIKRDSANNLFWLNSDVGFTAVKIRANHPDSVLFENFSEAGGIPVKGWIDFVINRDGSLITSEGNNSIKRFDYKKIKETGKAFDLHLTQIRLNNEAICWSNLKNRGKNSQVLPMELQMRFGKLLAPDRLVQMARAFSGVRYDSIIPFDLIPYNLSLPYMANSISFDFAAIDPHFSNSTSYQYMLEGFDRTWSPLSKGNNASFGNLREGHYTFKLKGLNPYGIWSELSYSFKVLPPWYRTWWAYVLYILVFISGIFLFIRWRTRALMKEKTMLEEKVNTRTAELHESLENLKATQGQLIQSEKMASLGELTAGIAHEIQNPLNFVNNFSDLNRELLVEMKEEMNNGNIEDAKAIAEDVISNEEKINLHGKRADAIVKGMLQHSRSSSGVKEPTDINALADEYFRLAYHGLRAKDKSFNVTMNTDLDESAGLIRVIPQDMGRVILNLITNAFYAVDEKKKSGLEVYEPTVSVSTKKEHGKVEIRVADNGNGIPQKVLDKIFQPFFTTKPTGVGTGLGLSLSYDIVKAHGGEIKVETKEGEGTTFTIQLPI